MSLEGFEPPTFGSGIRRAANCAISSKMYFNSAAGIRTRVTWVKTRHPDQLDYCGYFYLLFFVLFIFKTHKSTFCLFFSQNLKI